MPAWTQYLLPTSVAEAVQNLLSAPGPAFPIAGGTDLLLEIQQGRHCLTHTLVDLTRIPEMQALENRGRSLFIGAAVPVRLIAESPLVHQHALAVSEACGLIGGPQVRNTATLGGNVAHALPAADGMITLLALDARVEIAGPLGRRQEPILSLFRSLSVNNLADGEILTGFYIHERQQGQASAFGRVMRPQGVALPVLNLAVWLEREGERISQVRIAAGPSGPVPLRATAVEDCLCGAVFNKDTLALAVETARTSLHFRSSPQRATAAYRYLLCDMLLEEVLTRAWERTR
jgi:xanthine dehydrogenase FAD-binding subunit